MRIIEDIKLDFNNVLIVPKRSSSISRSMIDLKRQFVYSPNEEIFCIPLIAANMDTVATFEMARAMAKQDCMTALHKHYTIEELLNFFDNEDPSVTNLVFYSLGITDEDVTKLKAVINNTTSDIKNICVDCANGHTDYFVDRVKKIKEIVGNDVFIMAGNACTPEMTEHLVLSGVHCVKIGIGGGSVCLTRVMTGIGYPMLSAVIECGDAAHGLGGFICSDGGCTRPGDVSKAFAGGADFVMLGDMLAGHDESGGELCYEDGTKYVDIEDVINEIKGKYPYCETLEDNRPLFKKFYGMSSKEAQDKHNGGVADYKAAEGKTVMVPYRGPVENTIKEILGGVRSTCTYVGAIKLKHLSKCATFIRTTSQENQIFK